MLGEDFAGVLGCDYFSAYRKFMRICDIRVQFCLAHLIRDLKYLTTLCNKQTVAYGKLLLDEMRKLFGIIHRCAKMGKNAFRKALCDQRRTIIDIAIRGAPDTRHAQNMVKRFEKHESEASKIRGSDVAPDVLSAFLYYRTRNSINLPYLHQACVKHLLCRPSPEY